MPLPNLAGGRSSPSSRFVSVLSVRSLPPSDLTSLRSPKHLGVLRDVGLVHVRRNGRHRYYKTNAEAIRPLHEWTGTFEKLWRNQLLRVKERAEEKFKASQGNSPHPFPKEES